MAVASVKTLLLPATKVRTRVPHYTVSIVLWEDVLNLKEGVSYFVLMSMKVRHEVEYLDDVKAFLPCDEKLEGVGCSRVIATLAHPCEAANRKFVFSDGKALMLNLAVQSTLPLRAQYRVRSASTHSCRGNVAGAPRIPQCRALGQHPREVIPRVGQSPTFLYSEGKTLDPFPPEYRPACASS